MDPFTASVEELANFLATRFKKGLSWSTVAGYRSAISAFHGGWNGVKVGDCPEINRLVRGVFNLRPPQRKLAPNWNLEKVLEALSKEPYEPMAKVPLKWLTLKTAFLTALAMAGRASDLVRLGRDPPYICFGTQGVRLVPIRLRKQCRMGHSKVDIFLPCLHENRRLDPVRALRLYIKRTVPDGNCASLFLTMGKIKKQPAARTMSKWLVQVIESVPGAVGRVKAHSTRQAATSVAFESGVSLDEIVKSADWSSSSVFCHHYLREMGVRRRSFAAGVLGGGGPPS